MCDTDYIAAGVCTSARVYIFPLDVVQGAPLPSWGLRGCRRVRAWQGGLRASQPRRVQQNIRRRSDSTVKKSPLL